MTLPVGLPFVATFAFARPVAADRRNAAGALVSTPAGVPRYDHDASGKRLGLLVTDGPLLGQHDALTVLAGSWAMPGAHTVLFEWTELRKPGLVRRRALYTQNVRASVDACMASAGHHRMIGAVPGFLPNLGGFVRYRTVEWPLGRALGVGGSLALGDSSGRPVIEST